jgi:hypothetical protein
MAMNPDIAISAARRRMEQGAPGTGLASLSRADHSFTGLRLRPGYVVGPLIKLLPPGALIYLHATRERDEAIAAGMGKLLKGCPEEGHTAPRIGHATGTPPQASLLRIAR